MGTIFLSGWQGNLDINRNTLNRFKCLHVALPQSEKREGAVNFLTHVGPKPAMPLSCERNPRSNPII